MLALQAIASPFERQFKRSLGQDWQERLVDCKRVALRQNFPPFRPAHLARGPGSSNDNRLLLAREPAIQSRKSLLDQPRLTRARGARSNAPLFSRSRDPVPQIRAP